MDMDYIDNNASPTPSPQQVSLIALKHHWEQIYPMTIKLL